MVNSHNQSQTRPTAAASGSPNTGISSPLFHRLERRLARPLRAFVRSSPGQTPLREPTVLDEWPTVELHFVFCLVFGWLAGLEPNCRENPIVCTCLLRRGDCMCAESRCGMIRQCIGVLVACKLRSIWSRILACARNGRCVFVGPCESRCLHVPKALDILHTCTRPWSLT